MRLRSWSGEFVRACAAISLLAYSLRAQTPSAKVPLVVVLDGAETEQWRAWSADRGWRVVTAPVVAGKSVDARILALQGAVEAALKDASADPARVYLAGRGESAAAVFYTAARVPDLWTAAVAIGGSPQPAIDTDRFFAVNFSQAPVLWLGAAAGDDAVAAKLTSADVNLEFRPASGATPAAVLDWLAKHRRDPFPAEVDCETTSPQFASCYWIRMTKFDPTARNDVLPSTRIQPGSRATLDLGGFGYSRDDKGPGVLVNWLPDKYSGSLKLNDRISAIGGKPLKDATELEQLLESTVEEKPVVVSVQRGKDRVRLETRIVLPRREEVVTARVQGKFLPEEKEIQVVSRTVTELRVTIPEAWAGAALSWNGTPLVKVEAAGCWVLTLDKQLQSAKPCPP